MLHKPIDRELRIEKTRFRQSRLCPSVVPLRSLRTRQKSIGNKGSEPCVNRSLKFRNCPVKPTTKNLANDQGCVPDAEKWIAGAQGEGLFDMCNRLFAESSGASAWPIAKYAYAALGSRATAL